MSTVALWIAVAVLGGAGALGRFWLDSLVSRRTSGSFPYGTFAVNTTGSFALGVLVGLGLGGDALLLAGTALLGAYTTFSTWMLETQRLLEDGEALPALANIAASLVCGLAAAGAGWALGAAAAA